MSNRPRDVPTSFIDLKPDDFPFKMEFLNAFGIPVHTSEVTGPGVLDIHRIKGVMRIRISFAHGMVMDYDIPPESRI